MKTKKVNLPNLHKHEWVETETKVLPHAKSRLSFVDTIYQRKCECGAIESYNLERKK